jgi:hypothetical protein
MFTRIILLSFFIIIQSSALFSQGYDAIIISKCKECKLIRNNKTIDFNKSGKPLLKLAKGDVINIKKQDDIQIQVTNSKVRIIKTNKSGNEFSLKIVENNESELKNSESYTYFQSSAKSRNAETEPPNDATILYKTPVFFSWNNKDEPSIKIIDINQKLVWKQNVKGMSSISIIPKEIGLKPGKTYIWKLEGSGSKFLINIIDEKSENNISD